MPINVVCPGCMKRFQVSEKFAGKRGPCPSCKTIIDIPKEQVVVHAPDEFVSGGKTVKGRAILKPITRLNTDFKLDHILSGFGGALVVIALAAVLGRLELDLMLRNLIGAVGLFLISFPLVLFGYLLLREGDDLDTLEGGALYKKSAICAVIYSVLWIFFEFLAKYMSADTIFIWVYLTPIVIVSMIAVHAIFDFDFGRGLLHYFVFFAPVILLRGLLELGWIWAVVVQAATGAGGNGPPPPPPGLGR